jgi:hypothetical protein
VQRRVGLLSLLVPLLTAGWATAALWFDSTYPELFAALFVIAVAASLFVFRRSWQRVGALTLLSLGVLCWWLQITPSNTRNWQEDVSRLPSVDLRGDQVTFHNVRNFEYRSDSDYTPHWESRTYKLSDLRGVDLYLSDWGSPGIVHTIASWDFGPGQHLAISIETRKEIGETYSAIRGFFRQYELYYVVADERDVVGVRAQFRDEKLHLYRLRIPPAAAGAILLSYVESINQLQQEPQWYNALTANCTTSIRLHTKSAGVAKALNWRLFVNKYIDELLYMRESVTTAIPLEELRERSDITAEAKAAASDSKFSEIIRQKLPER